MKQEDIQYPASIRDAYARFDQAIQRKNIDVDLISALVTMQGQLGTLSPEQREGLAKRVADGALAKIKELRRIPQSQRVIPGWTTTDEALAMSTATFLRDLGYTMPSDEQQAAIVYGPLLSIYEATPQNPVVAELFQDFSKHSPKMRKTIRTYAQ
ncbi:hypothetical protein FJZ22_03280 [Candidatus Pacearchaeota archaeon]|nr:hypothetical protein [Candidatus Pacearchaeota archaeon]